MATWNEVRAFVAQNFTISDDFGSSMVLLFNTSEGRSQYIQIIDLTEVNNSISLCSPVGVVSEIGDANFRAICSNVFYGGIRIINDKVYVVHTVLLADLSNEELIEPMDSIMYSADSLEAQYVGGDAF